jgi:hypothetical protein
MKLGYKEGGNLHRNLYTESRSNLMNVSPYQQISSNSAVTYQNKDPSKENKSMITGNDEEDDDLMFLVQEMDRHFTVSRKTEV